MTSPLATSAADLVLASSVIALVLGGGLVLLRSLFKRPERIPVRVRTGDDQQR